MLEITVKAPPEAGIAAITELKSELLSAIMKASVGSKIVFDMSKTTRADSSLAQLMIAFNKEAMSKDISVEIRGNDKACSMMSLLCCDNCDDCCGAKQGNRVEPSGGVS